MARIDVTAAFRAVLGWFLVAPAAFALVRAFAPSDALTQAVYALPIAALAGVVGGYVAVRERVAPRRLSWALVTLYVTSFVLIVAVQSAARLTVGWLGGPWVALASLAGGAACAYWVGFRRR